MNRILLFAVLFTCIGVVTLTLLQSTSSQEPKPVVAAEPTAEQIKSLSRRLQRAENLVEALNEQMAEFKKASEKRIADFEKASQKRSAQFETTTKEHVDQFVKGERENLRKELKVFQDVLAQTARSMPITNTIGMKMVYIPPGKFLMGSPMDEKERGEDEGPQHEVTITKGFYLGQYEVTQDEYEAVMGKNPSWFSASGGGKEKVKGKDTSRFPVEQVSWKEADEFCRELTKREHEAGKLPCNEKYRLPTEAEWEYACRGGAKKYHVFHYGDWLASTQANFNGNFPYGGADKGPYLMRTEEVGSYKPNGFGLHDMHGNVWEWCEDWFDEKTYQRGNSSGPLKGSSRVFRGGSWNDLAGSCCSAIRDRIVPVYRNDFLGFRLARSSVE